MGTFNLLQASLEIKKILPSIIFHHVSTDEVYGDLDFHEAKFTEFSNYQPSSPYSASKASSDLLVQSWARTFDLNYIITNCSNNFGARQHTEKLIPTVIRKILGKKKIPIYGNGLNIRDWIFAKDHAQAIISIHEHGLINEKINIGGDHEISNLALVKLILEMMDCNEDLIEFVDDRLGHDLRYAIDNSKIYSLTDWRPSQDFIKNIQKTIEWYQNNPNWWEK
jgi:dTDP-glucose 4,6-dehydratase